MNPSISIIIPAYNEALRIGPTLETLSPTYEIIVVDDGSTDETLSVLRKFPRIRILINEKNKGKGYSVKRGMLEAKGDYRLFMDADNSVTIANLPRFVEEIKKGADIVIGSIELPSSVTEDANYSYRRVLGKWAKWLIRSLAVPGIYDTQRGFKLFTAKSAQELFPLQTTERWGFDIEILTHAQKKGFKIKEIPVEWHNSGGSKVTIWSYFGTLWELVKIKMSV